MKTFRAIIIVSAGLLSIVTLVFAVSAALNGYWTASGLWICSSIIAGLTISMIPKEGEDQ